MGRGVAALVAAVLVGGVILAASAADASGCEPGVSDAAGVLAVSSRLDGAAEALHRDGVASLVRTVKQGSAEQNAVDLAARCPALARPAADAVLVVVGPAPDVAVVAVGSTTVQQARVTRGAIAERLERGDTDIASAVAQGLEKLWQARAVSDVPVVGDAPAKTNNPWAAARRRQAAKAAAGGGTAAALAVQLALTSRRRRRNLAAARAEARQCRAALAEQYVDLDAAVVAAAAARPGTPPHTIAEAVDVAAERAAAALLATTDSAAHRLAEVRAAATTCRHAEQALRDAVDAVRRAEV